MKNALFLIFIISMLSGKMLSQDDSRLGIFGVYHLISANEIDNTYKAKGLTFEYQDRVGYSFNLIYGMSFINEIVTYNTNLVVGPERLKDSKQNLISIFTGLKGERKHLYLAVGPVLTFELNKIKDIGYLPQSGLGVLFQLGVEFHIKQLVFSLGPDFQAGRIIKFNKINRDDYGEPDIIDFNGHVMGRIGISYKFF